MTRIAYGICSEGMGHATRSQVVIDHLLSKGHEVHIFTSDRAYEFFEKQGYQNIHEIRGFHLVYQKDALRNMHSMFKTLREIPEKIPAFRIIAQAFKDICPQIVISDFEVFTAFLGSTIRVPVISANNISILDHTKLDATSVKHVYPKLFALTTSQLSTLSADMYVIPTYFFPKPKGKKVFLTDPPIRQAIRDAETSTKDHVLVYQTSSTCLGLLKVLNRLDEKFIVYGFGKRKKRKHLTFYDFSTTRFVKHLASAKAVIIGGGFSLLSEALFLKKPVMSVPLRRHFEQIVNAYYLEKCKFGEYHQQPDETDVRDFLLKLPLYEHYLRDYSPDPMQFARRIEQLVRKHAKEPAQYMLKMLSRFMP